MVDRIPTTRLSGERVLDDEGVSGVRRSGARDRRPIRALIVTLVMVAVLLVVALVGFLVLANTPAFTIVSIDAVETEHLTPDNIAKLASIADGTTLLTFDEAQITTNLKRNPWVGSVSYTREFPDKLLIEVTERKVDCLVKMSTGSVCWCLGDDDVWIEPINLTVLDGQSADDVALALAQDMGAVLITDVPTAMSPSAGEAATDEVLKAIALYREQFSKEFVAQIVRFSASSAESISCTLKSGVEVSLGAPNNIDIKEEDVTQILEKHPNQVTYINVRVPAQPSYRKLGVETVSEGTGVTVGIDPDATTSPATPVDSTQQQTQDSTTTDATGDGTDATQTTQDGPVTGEEGTDTEGKIQGDDGYWYTYEEYYGLD